MPSAPEPSPASEGTGRRTKSLLTKFVQTLLLVAGIIGVSTLVIVGVMSAQASNEHLRSVQQYIEEGIASKGKVLTQNHALALRGLTRSVKRWRSPAARCPRPRRRRSATPGAASASARGSSR